ncbi:MAG: HAMP domain-containing protein [Anaerolineae bacterium]|nr:HAMP domain-containing protein [Anaerolineae bacterium]
MRRARSLRQRLMRTYAVLIVLVLALVIAWAGLVVQNSRIEHRRQELEVEVLFIAGVLAETTAGETTADWAPPRLQDIAASLGGQVKRRLVVVDDRGHVLADSAGELAPLVRISDAEIAAVLRSEGLYASAPIDQGNQALGTVYLAMPVSELQSRVYRQWLLLVGPGLLVALATGAVGLWLANRILEPVRALTQTAQEMAGGALDRRIAVDSADELGDMGRAFNWMADRVTGMLAQQRVFVANASHELRTPLTSIQLWLEALLGGAKDDPETAARFLGEIARQIQRLSHMVEQLLNLSRLESGLVSTERAPTPLPGFVRGVVAELAPLFEQKNHVVQLEIHDSLPSVPLDPDQIRQALINLLDNASKYTPPGGQIRVVVDRHSGDEQRVGGSASARPMWVRVSVSDSGPGIPEQDMPHIFERFYRGAEARSGGEKGAGLGLAIVRYIVESQHGGRVWAESETGRGTTVHFTLPLNPPMP